MTRYSSRYSRRFQRIFLCAFATTAAFLAVAQDEFHEPEETVTETEPETLTEATEAPDNTWTPDPAAQPGLDNRPALEAFIDGLLAAQLEAFDTAGATVSVVKDGEIIFAKGYGLADVENDVDVVAAETLFRIGSVSKLFVWTAVMQLAEQGKLDLNADINTYLQDFKIPETFDQPVTLTNLLSHTPGFEDHVIGLFARDESAMYPLGEVLAGQIPARVRPPGITASYSNHGTAMAAHIVATVAGTDWDTYVEQNIFQPLGMEDTTFRQPLPESLAPQMSKGYSWSGNEFKEEIFEFVPISPAGSVASTSVDMAKFMIAHLQLGEYNGGRILQEDTARQMHTSLFTHHPGINAIAYGFYEVRRDEPRVIGHGGDTIYFHTQLALIPEDNVGFFVSYNSAAGYQGRNQFVEKFLERYYPHEDPPELTPSEDFAKRAGRYAGWFRPNRYSHTTAAKVAAFGAFKVDLDEEGDALIVSTDPTTRWIEIEPLLFREEDGEARLAFHQNDRGKITYLFLGDLPILGFERVSWWEAPPIQNSLALIAALVFVATLVFWPVSALLRWRYDAAGRGSDRIPLASRALAWLASFFFVAFAVSMALMVSDQEAVVFGLPDEIDIVFTLPIIAAVFSAGVVAAAVIAWKESHGRLLGRIFYTLIALCCITALLQLYYWNLLGYRY